MLLIQTSKICLFPQGVYSLEVEKTSLKLKSTTKCLRGYNVGYNSSLEVECVCVALAAEERIKKFSWRSTGGPCRQIRGHSRQKE